MFSFFNAKKRALNPSQKSIKESINRLILRACENPDQEMLTTVDTLSGFISQDDKEHILAIVDVIKEVIKSPEKSEISKFHALSMLAFLTKKRNHHLEKYFTKKIMDRLFSIAQHQYKDRSIMRGKTCLKQFNRDANEDHSLKFFILLLECWKKWAEIYPTDDEGKTSKIKVKHAALVSMGVSFPSSYKYYDSVEKLKNRATFGTADLSSYIQSDQKQQQEKMVLGAQDQDLIMRKTEMAESLFQKEKPGLGFDSEIPKSDDSEDGDDGDDDGDSEDKRDGGFGGFEGTGNQFQQQFEQKGQEDEDGFSGFGQIKKFEDHKQRKLPHTEQISLKISKPEAHILSPHSMNRQQQHSQHSQQKEDSFGIPSPHHNQDPIQRDNEEEYDEDDHSSSSSEGGGEDSSSDGAGDQPRIKAVAQKKIKQVKLGLQQHRLQLIKFLKENRGSLSLKEILEEIAVLDTNYEIYEEIVESPWKNKAKYEELASQLELERLFHSHVKQIMEEVIQNREVTPMDCYESILKQHNRLWPDVKLSENLDEIQEEGEFEGSDFEQEDFGFHSNSTNRIKKQKKKQQVGGFGGFGNTSQHQEEQDDVFANFGSNNSGANPMGTKSASQFEGFEGGDDFQEGKFSQQGGNGGFADAFGTAGDFSQHSKSRDFGEGSQRMPTHPCNPSKQSRMEDEKGDSGAFGGFGGSIAQDQQQQQQQGVDFEDPFGEKSINRSSNYHQQQQQQSQFQEEEEEEDSDQEENSQNLNNNISHSHSNSHSLSQSQYLARNQHKKFLKTSQHEEQEDVFGNFGHSTGGGGFGGGFNEPEIKEGRTATGFFQQEDPFADQNSQDEYQQQQQQQQEEEEDEDYNQQEGGMDKNPFDDGEEGVIDPFKNTGVSNRQGQQEDVFGGFGQQNNQNFSDELNGGPGTENFEGFWGNQGTNIPTEGDDFFPDQKKHTQGGSHPQEGKVSNTEVDVIDSQRFHSNHSAGFGKGGPNQKSRSQTNNSQGHGSGNKQYQSVGFGGQNFGEDYDDDDDFNTPETIHSPAVLVQDGPQYREEGHDLDAEQMIEQERLRDLQSSQGRGDTDRSGGSRLRREQLELEKRSLIVSKNQIEQKRLALEKQSKLQEMALQKQLKLKSEQLDLEMREKLQEELKKINNEKLKLQKQAEINQVNNFEDLNRERELFQIKKSEMERKLLEKQREFEKEKLKLVMQAEKQKIQDQIQRDKQTKMLQSLQEKKDWEQEERAGHVKLQEQSQRKEELISLERKMNEHDQSLRDQYASNIKQFQEAIRSLRAELLEKSGKEQQLLEENETMKSKEVRLHDGLKEATSQLKLIERENASIKIFNAELEARAQVSEKKLAQMEGTDIDAKLSGNLIDKQREVILDQLTQTIEFRDKEIYQMETMIGKKDRELVGLRNKTEKLERLTQDYEEEITNIRDKMYNQVQEKRREFENEQEDVMVGLKTQIQDLEMSLQQEENEKIELKSKLMRQLNAHAIQEGRSRLSGNPPNQIQGIRSQGEPNSEAEDLRLELARVQEQNRELRERIVQTKVDKERVERDSRASLGQLSSLRDRQHTEMTKMNGLKEELHEVRQDLYTKNSEVSELLEKLASLEMDHSKVVKDLEETQEREFEQSKQLNLYHNQMMGMSKSINDRSVADMSTDEILENDKLETLQIKNEALQAKMSDLLDENIMITQQVSELQIQGSLKTSDTLAHEKAYQTLRDQNEQAMDELFRSRQKIMELEETAVDEEVLRSKVHSLEREFSIVRDLLSSDEIMSNKQARSYILESLNTPRDRTLNQVRSAVMKVFQSLESENQPQFQVNGHSSHSQQQQQQQQQQNIGASQSLNHKIQNGTPLVFDNDDFQVGEDNNNTSGAPHLQVQQEQYSKTVQHKVTFKQEGGPVQSQTQHVTTNSVFEKYSNSANHPPGQNAAVLSQQLAFQEESKARTAPVNTEIKDNSYFQTLTSNGSQNLDWKLASVAFSPTRFYENSDLILYYCCPNNISSNQEEVVVNIHIQAKKSIKIDDISIQPFNIVFKQPEVQGHQIKQSEEFSTRIKFEVLNPEEVYPPEIVILYQTGTSQGSAPKNLKTLLPFTQYNLLQRIKSTQGTCQSIFQNFSKQLVEEFRINSEVFKYSNAHHGCKQNSLTPALDITSFIKEAVKGVHPGQFWILCSSLSGRNFVVLIEILGEERMRLTLKCASVDLFSQNYLGALRYVFSGQ